MKTFKKKNEIANKKTNESPKKINKNEIKPMGTDNKTDTKTISNANKAENKDKKDEEPLRFG